LRLPHGLIHAIANQVSHVANLVAGWGSDAIVSLTRDYVEHSSYLTHFLKKVHVLDAPVELAPTSEADMRAFREKFGIHKGQRIIGMAARMATEKGVEYLVQALPQVLERVPEARVLFVGSYQNVVGEEGYIARILQLIEGMKEHWSLLGNLSDVEMTAFFKTCEVLVLPSLNSTEGFGLVQVEAMSCGTPVVASDLPGVRVPVKTSGMGKIVPAADAGAIARAILDILAQPELYRGNSAEITHKYSPDLIATGYENLFKHIL
jgi:glycosyltransferase involved in cell wall biosynthesis